MQRHLLQLFQALLFSLLFCILSCQKKAPQSVTIIKLWAHEGQPAEKEALESIFSAFNASQSNIKLVYEFKQEQGYGSRVIAAALAKDLPDIIEIDGPYTAQFADQGILTPIDGLITEEMRNDFLPTILSQGTVNDRLYTLGAFESTVVLYYSKDILKECAIPFPSASLDNAMQWDLFLSLLQNIKDKKPGITPLETFIPWSGEWLTYAFTPLIWSNNGKILDNKGNTVRGFLDNQQSIEALQQWQRLFKEKLSDHSLPEGLFEQKKAAFVWGIFNRWPLYKKAGLNFGIAPLPYITTPKSPSGSWCWGMTTQSKKKAAAWEVLTWIVSAKNGILPLCKANAGIPSRLSAIELYSEYSETRSLFIEQLKTTAQSRPITAAYGTLTLEISSLFYDIALGATVKEAVANTVIKLENSIKE